MDDEQVVVNKALLDKVEALVYQVGEEYISEAFLQLAKAFGELKNSSEYYIDPLGVALDAGDIGC